MVEKKIAHIMMIVKSQRRDSWKDVEINGTAIWKHISKVWYNI